jgi:hypothetical protein
MVKTTAKSPEYMQAQVADFVAYGDLAYEEALALRKNIGSMAVAEEGTDFEDVYLGRKLDVNDPGLSYVDDPRDIKVGYKSYLDYLRLGMGSEDRERIRNHHEVMLQAYDRYKPAVDRLFTDVASYDNAKEHPQYLGSGSNGSAFWFEFEGQRLVAKRSHGHKNEAASEGASHQESAPFYSGNKIKGLQHQVAASPEDETVITELLSGKTADKLTYGELAAIPDDQIRQAMDLVREMDQGGLIFDPKHTNIMYDSELGFSILDYHIRKGNISPENNASNYVAWLRPVLAPNISSTLEYDSDQPYNSSHNTAAMREARTNGMSLQKRMLRILDTHYPDVVLDLVKRQAEIDADPRRGGSVFIDMYGAEPDDAEELKEWYKYILERGLTEKPRPPIEPLAEGFEVEDYNFI